MKQLLVTFFMLNLLNNPLAGQPKIDTCCFLKKSEIIGTWQLNDSIVGSGLGQNFQFFKNDRFVLNLGNDADDARDIIQLKGKYQLVKDTLFFIITSRTVLDGPIEIADPGISLNIFSILSGKPREIPEQDSGRPLDPCYITFFSKQHIKINGENYYKINE